MTTAQERPDLLRELGLDIQNHAALGRVLGTGIIAEATERRRRHDGGDDPDQRGRTLPGIPRFWSCRTAVIIELEVINDDKNTHCALLPSNGDRKFIWLVNHSKGRATLNLDGPGYYWYSSPTGNDEGRGLTGAIVVLGDVPPEARLDRPPQPRP